jgi:hypothetical protein
MEELDMDEELRPEFACPYCYEDHDIGSLCAHLEEEHPYEPQAAVSAPTGCLNLMCFASYGWLERIEQFFFCLVDLDG